MSSLELSEVKSRPLLTITPVLVVLISFEADCKILGLLRGAMVGGLQPVATNADRELVTFANDICVACAMAQ
jgi:hypothetical protein